MPQALVFLEKGEDAIIMFYSNKWNLSKAETIKRIILEFKEGK